MNGSEFGAHHESLAEGSELLLLLCESGIRFRGFVGVFCVSPSTAPFALAAVAPASGRFLGAGLCNLGCGSGIELAQKLQAAFHLLVRGGSAVAEQKSLYCLFAEQQQAYWAL